MFGCVYARTVKGRSVLLMGPSNTGKSMLIKGFRVCALRVGSTKRLPDDGKFSLQQLDKAQLVWEEEAADSPVLKLPHPELMPVLDGDYKNREAPRKGLSTIRVTFEGHHCYASNLIFAEMYITNQRPQLMQ